MFHCLIVPKEKEIFVKETREKSGVLDIDYSKEIPAFNSHEKFLIEKVSISTDDGFVAQYLLADNKQLSQEEKIALLREWSSKLSPLP